MKIRYPFKNEQPVPPSPTGDELNIVVTDANDEPIADASVTVEPKGDVATVSVTCKDAEQNLLNGAFVMLMTENAEPNPSNTIGTGVTNSDGTTLIYEFNVEDGLPTDVVKEVPYDDYYLMATYTYFDDDESMNITLTYIGELTVNSATVNTTITLESE